MGLLLLVTKREAVPSWVSSPDTPWLCCCESIDYQSEARIQGSGHKSRLNSLILSLLAALAVPAWSADEFEFVVIGDTRPRFESESLRTFENLIPKLNAVRPAFVVNLGDLIYGYGLLSKEKQWDRYQQVSKGILAPYHQLPGNHDTYSRQARRIYSRRFGKFYESFDYGDCHFVLLDNTEEGHWGYLGPAELEWLKTDLEQTKARSVFVFLHFPVWETERVAPKYYQFWVQTLHPLFRESRVRAVFGGHLHSYGPTREYDGIRYYITGGGGAELRPDYRKSGGVHHFLRVKVSGDSYDRRVVTDRGELRDADADVMGGLMFAERNCSSIGLEQGSQDLKAGVKCTLALTNPYQEFLSGEAEWNLESSVCSVEPQRIPFRISPGGTHHFSFALKFLKDTVPPPALPQLEFNVVAGRRHHRFYREVLFLQKMLTRCRSVPPVLDGRLEEWGGVPPLSLGGGAKRDAELRAVHDEKTLYLAVAVPAMNAARSDESAFHDDLQIGIAGRLILNLSFPVPDGEADAKEPTDPSINSFSYQVRYGGDPLVPVHFVELILEPKR